MSAESLHAAADGAAASAKVRIARRVLAPARITRHRPGGMIYREVRAALPVMAVLAVIAAFPALLVVLESRYPGHFTAFRYERGLEVSALPDVWRILTLIVFLVAGVLCGAEEAENGTSDLIYRLPVSHARVFVEKTTGALLAVAIWVALSLFLTAAVLAGGLQADHWPVGLPSVLGVCRGVVMDTILPGLLFFTWGQAAGAWSNNVLAGAIGGGSIALAIYFVCAKMFTLGGWWEYAAYVASQRVLLAASALALVLALDRFLTHEGR